MPLIRKSASDVTTYRRVSATNLPVPTIKSSGYTAPFRNIIAPIARASDAGAGASPGNTVLQVNGGVVPAPPAPPTAITGSLYFDAVFADTTPIGSWFTVTNPVGNLSPGTGDFTIEWWQYLSTNTYKNRPFVFMLGTNTLGFFLEGPDGIRTPSVVVNGLSLPALSSVTDDAWAHFAIVRSTGVIKVYYNGLQIADFANASDISVSDPLLIGTNSLTPMINDIFEGYITNFRWVVGTAVYTSNFTPSLNNLPVIPGTQLLFLALPDKPQKNSAPDAVPPYDIGAYGVIEGSSYVPT